MGVLSKPNQFVCVDARARRQNQLRIDQGIDRGDVLRPFCLVL